MMGSQLYFFPYLMLSYFILGTKQVEAQAQVGHKTLYILQVGSRLHSWLNHGPFSSGFNIWPTGAISYFRPSMRTACNKGVKKLAIDRLISCDETATGIECSIFCRRNMVFQFDPAPVYTCLFTKGEFSPQPIPRCVNVTKCDGGRVFKPCGPPRQPGCKDPDVGNNIDKNKCVDGCFCPEGQVWHENKCITRDQCPCEDNGKNYAPGSTITRDCSTCTCINQKWNCTETPCDTTCGIIGDPHYTTFDGKKYDFYGRCSYYLVKSQKFSIEAETPACSGYTYMDYNADPSLPSCTKSVTIRTKRQVIKLEQKFNVVINGRKVKIPYQIGNIVIKMISSTSLEVTLPNGVQILWDGQTKVDIKLPGDFKEKTEGLCGTYNKKQADDFLTPNGTIATSPILFGNSWKTNDQCGDLPPTPQPHPCDSDIQNKKRAEQQCQIIKSDLFSKCHKIVNSDTYYQNCLYDTCSCGQDYAKCLCTMVGSYADACARQGIIIDWRKEKKECQIQCPKDQKYQICGNSCARTCSDISERPDCKAQCVDGCNCPEGQALDEKDKCVPIGKCKCLYDGLSFPPGFQEIRPGAKGQELCTCVNALWSCRPATKNDTAKTTEDRCKSSLNMEFSKCVGPKPMTCKNYHNSYIAVTTPCHTGCKCKDGYVLNTASRNCVKLTECPCYYCGQIYEENEIIDNSSFNCRCQTDTWKCKFSPEGCYSDWKCLL